MARCIFAVLLSYITGAVPTSYIIARLLKGIDIRKYGSGNVGATNLMRVVGRGPGIAALILDIIKGIIPVVLVAPNFYNAHIHISEPLFKIILGLAAIAGHIWTVFLRFKGGKGVATTIGVFIGLSPIAMAMGLLVWLIVAVTFRYVSLSSLAMALSLPFFMLALGRPPEYIILSIVVFIFIAYSHRSNIGRLIDGKEYRIGERVKK